MKTVLAQTAGLEASAVRMPAVKASPMLGGASGCSLAAVGATIQDTCGRESPATSLAKAATRFWPKDFSAGPSTKERPLRHRSVFWSPRKLVKQDSGLSPKLSRS